MTKYEFNKTMKLIGRQTNFEYLNPSEISDIITANMEFGKDIYDTCLDGFSLGFIYGVRAERSKKTTKSLNDKIADYLQQEKIDTDILADKSGLSEDKIFDICFTDAEIGAIDYYKVCKALNVSLDYFMPV